MYENVILASMWLHALSESLLFDPCLLPCCSTCLNPCPAHALMLTVHLLAWLAKGQ